MMGRKKRAESTPAAGPQSQPTNTTPARTATAEPDAELLERLSWGNSGPEQRPLTAVERAVGRPAERLREQTAEPDTPATPTPAPTPATPRGPVTPIGRSVHIKGELTSDEELIIDGSVEGKINVRDQLLTIGEHGRIKADIETSSIVVRGTVEGDIVATDRAEVEEGGTVIGDIKAPRVVLADGASFTGSVDMSAPAPKPTPKTEPAPAAEAKAPADDEDAARLANLFDTTDGDK